MSAAQPLPTKSSSSAGKNRREFIQESLFRTGTSMLLHHPAALCLPHDLVGEALDPQRAAGRTPDVHHGGIDPRRLVLAGAIEVQDPSTPHHQHQAVLVAEGREVGTAAAIY